MIITELTDSECAEWDNYVHTTPHGLPQHLSGWRHVLYQTSRYDTRYLLARVNGRIAGILPLFFIRSPLTGSTATTMPGGFCADDEHVARGLIEHGQAVARRAKINRFLLHDSRQCWPGPLHTTSDHVYWLVEMGSDESALWSRLGNSIRRQVRIARKNGLTAVTDYQGDQLGAFYDVLSPFTHQMGTPVFSRSFLENIIETFPGGFNIVVVRQEERPVGAYFQLQMNDTVYGMWGGTLHQYVSLRPVYLAYWHILQESLVQGYAYLDMGRSPVGSNASDYKRQWGGIARPVYQQVMAIGPEPSAAAPASQIKTANKFQIVRQLWPKLPFPVAQYLGPKLRRHMPFA